MFLFKDRKLFLFSSSFLFSMKCHNAFSEAIKFVKYFTTHFQ